MAILLYDSKNNYCDDLTINLSGFFIADIDEGFINSDINLNSENKLNVVQQLKEIGVIKESYGFRKYNYGSYEYVKFDLEKLKEYDSNGVNDFYKKIEEYDKIYLYNARI